MFTKISDRFRSRPLLDAQNTAAAAQAYVKLTPGTMGATLRAIVTKGNAADLVLSLKYADSAGGQNAAAYPVDVPIYVNNVRKADGKAATITGAAGSSIIDFCIDPAAIPDGKFVGLSFAVSNAATLIAAEVIEDVAYRTS